MICAGRLWEDTAHWFPRRRGTVKQWRKGRRCRNHALRGSTFCRVHQDQAPPVSKAREHDALVADMIAAEGF